MTADKPQQSHHLHISQSMPVLPALPVLPVLSVPQLDSDPVLPMPLPVVAIAAIAAIAPIAPADPPPAAPQLHSHKRPHPQADESEDGYSSHPSIYSASPVGSKESLVTGDGANDDPKPTDIFSPDEIKGVGAGSSSYSQQQIHHHRYTDGDSDSDSEYARAFHYEYASPVQPLYSTRDDMRGECGRAGGVRALRLLTGAVV